MEIKFKDIFDVVNFVSLCRDVYVYIAYIATGSSNDNHHKLYDYKLFTM